LTSFKRVTGQNFGVKCQIMFGVRGFHNVWPCRKDSGKFSWFSRPTRSSVTHMADFLQDFLFSEYVFFWLFNLPNSLHSKHYSLLLWTKEAHQQLKEDLSFFHLLVFKIISFF
jgi:hypothetical protein